MSTKAKKKHRRLTPEVRREVYRLSMAGLSGREISSRVGQSAGSVWAVLRRLGGVIRPYMLAGPMDHRLSLEDRVDIFAGLRAGLSFSTIGEQIGFSVSTVSREVGGCDRRDSYRPVPAHLAAERRRQRPKPTKLASNPVLCAKVIEGLEAWASPEQISNRLREPVKLSV